MIQGKKKFCQSCGIPLNKNHETIQGKEIDGSSSLKYCCHCYMNGQLIEPDITYDDMLKRGKLGIENGNNTAFMKFILKLSYPYQLQNLERWKK